MAGVQKPRINPAELQQRGRARPTGHALGVPLPRRPRSSSLTQPQELEHEDEGEDEAAVETEEWLFMSALPYSDASRCVSYSQAISITGAPKPPADLRLESQTTSTEKAEAKLKDWHINGKEYWDLVYESLMRRDDARREAERIATERVKLREDRLKKWAGEGQKERRGYTLDTYWTKTRV